LRADRRFKKVDASQWDFRRFQHIDSKRPLPAKAARCLIQVGDYSSKAAPTPLVGTLTAGLTVT
jgi:hypothetical protein